MTREEFEQFSVEYALGTLRGEELRTFEAYLDTASPDELAEAGELFAAASLLPRSLSPVSAPPHIRASLLQKVHLSERARGAVNQRLEETRIHDASQFRRWLPAGIAVAAVMGAMVLIFSMWNLRDTIDKQNRELTASHVKVTQLNTELVRLKDELTQKQELLKVLSSRRIEVAMMNGLQVNPVGFGKIIWDPEKGTAILQISHLPPVPQNKDYQLWIVKGKTPLSAGVFAVTDTTSNFFKVENLAITSPREISAFAVTLEPKGGVPAPTGEMYLAGPPKL